MNTKTLLSISALALGLFPLGLPARADSAMNGMNMGGMKMSQDTKPAPLLVKAAINPAAPRSGDNALDLLVTDAAGKPVTGLKLTTSVAMTSMDMGTTHPALVEKGGGHYRATVAFAMDGPWRVVVSNAGNQVAVMDFNAGAKTPWQSPPPAAPSAKPMPGMADMKTATIPQLQEIGTYTATGDENWKQQTGFGHNAPMVGMMNQMMVGGSGGEGMKMAPVKMDFGPANYAKPSAGDADSSMSGMDMGGGKIDSMKTDANPPAIKPAGPPGDAKAMPGMNMAAPTPGITPSASALLKITATTASMPKAGDNPLTISLTDAAGKPVTGAKITTSVAMTSMDMGTTHPAVTEKGDGKYAATVNFGMAGPWRVQVKVTAPGQKPQIKTFDFTVR